MEKPYVTNPADEVQVKAAREKEKFGRDLELSDMKFLLNTVQGRRVLWRYLKDCGIYQSSFRTSSEIYFLEGQRNIGLKILADIQEADAESYIKMMLENKKERN